MQEWLRFSYGAQAGTQQQGLILSTLITKLSTTFAQSPTDILGEMSSVGDRDVHILFHITPLQLTAKHFSLAVHQLATYVKQWGAKEMDFEVGSGPPNSTTEGVFQVRLGSGPLTAGTGISTSIPFSTVTVEKNSSPMPVVATSSSVGILPLRSSSKSSNGTLGLTTGPHNTSPSISLSYTAGTGNLSIPSIPVTGCSASFCPVSSNASQHSAPALTSSLGQDSIPSRPIATRCSAGSCPQFLSGLQHSLNIRTTGTGGTPLAPTSLATGCSAGFCSQTMNASQNSPFTPTTASNRVLLPTGTSGSSIRGNLDILSLQNSSKARLSQTKATMNSTLSAPISGTAPHLSSPLTSPTTIINSDMVSRTVPSTQKSTRIAATTPGGGDGTYHSVSFLLPRTSELETCLGFRKQLIG